MTISAILYSQFSPFGVTGFFWSLSQHSLDEEQGSTLDRSLIHREATHWLQIHQFSWTSMFLDCVNTWRKPTGAQGDHTSSTQKGPELGLKPATLWVWGHRGNHQDCTWLLQENKITGTVSTETLKFTWTISCFKWFIENDKSVQLYSLYCWQCLKVRIVNS